MEILDDTELQALHKQHIKMEMAFNFFLRKGNNEKKSKTSLKLIAHISRSRTLSCKDFITCEA